MTKSTMPLTKGQLEAENIGYLVHRNPELGDVVYMAGCALALEEQRNELRAENERLRAALEKIDQMPYDSLFCDAQDITEEALRGQQRSETDRTEGGNE